jgi:hypothetical protein
MSDCITPPAMESCSSRLGECVYSGKSAGIKESVRGIDVSGCKPAVSFFDLEISLLVASAFLAFASDLGLIVT